MSKESDDILADDDKGVRRARGIPSLFWRKLLQIRKIDGDKWDRLMNAFLMDPRNGVPDNPRDRSSTRGNVNRELRRDNMTWKVFLKALNFSGAVKVSFTLSVTFSDNKTYHISAKMLDQRTTLNVIEDESDEDDTLPQIPEIPEIDENTQVTASYQKPRLAGNRATDTKSLNDPYHRQFDTLKRAVARIVPPKKRD